MKRISILAAILFLLGGPAAIAAEGFVIEADNARPEIGVQLRSDTQISIDQGGHMVIMTEAGQMIRKDGPFNGTAGDIILLQVGDGATMAGGLMESLLELAEVSGKSEEQLGAVRGAEAETGDLPPGSINSSVVNFCLKEGQVPLFYTSNAPAVDEPFIVRRRVRPIQFLQTTWAAGENSLAWPADWPPAEKGRYIWALGSRGTVGLRIIELDEVPASQLEDAALHYDFGCDSQAKAIFKAALADVSSN